MLTNTKLITQLAELENKIAHYNRALTDPTRKLSIQEIAALRTVIANYTKDITKIKTTLNRTN